MKWRNDPDKRQRQNRAYEQIVGGEEVTKNSPRNRIRHNYPLARSGLTREPSGSCRNA